MNKVAIYVRQSNYSNAAETLEKQKAEVAEYCASKGFEVCDTVFCRIDWNSIFTAKGS